MLWTNTLVWKTHCLANVAMQGDIQARKYWESVCTETLNIQNLQEQDHSSLSLDNLLTHCNNNIRSCLKRSDATIIISVHTFDYNLIMSSLLLYSSLVLIWGCSSLMEGLQVSIGSTLHVMTFWVCPRSLQWWWSCTETSLGLHWACSLDMFPNAKLEMSAGFANIVCRAAWTCETINKPAFKHLLHWWLKCRQYCLEFSECHDDGTRHIDFVKRMCIILRAFSSILDEQSHFARSCVWLDWWFLCRVFYFSYDGIESLFNYTVIERGRVLVFLQYALCFSQAIMEILPRAIRTVDPVDEPRYPWTLVPLGG